MSILLVYPAVFVVIGIVVFVTKRRARARRRATPPWVLWQRGELYNDDHARRARRSRRISAVGLGALVAIPAMILTGFAGTAKRTDYRR